MRNPYLVTTAPSRSAVTLPTPSRPSPAASHRSRSFVSLAYVRSLGLMGYDAGHSFLSWSAFPLPSLSRKRLQVNCSAPPTPSLSPYILGVSPSLFVFGSTAVSEYVEGQLFGAGAGAESQWFRTFPPVDCINSAECLCFVERIVRPSRRDASEFNRGRPA